MAISIKAAAACLPEKIIENDFFKVENKDNIHKMFKGTNRRRHMQRDETMADFMANAALSVLEKAKLKPENIDLLLTHLHLSDEWFTGVGLMVVEKVGLKPKNIYDLQNTGCIAFIPMLELAQMLMESQKYKYALLINGQSVAGRIYSGPQAQTRPESSIPGDGTGAVILELDGDSPVIAIHNEYFPENSQEMFVYNEDGRKWWEPGKSQGYLHFTEERINSIIRKGSTLVPEMILKVCEKAQISTKDIDYLITNQPNPFFLKHWSKAIELPEERHFHTFSEYANLFGAGVPINLAIALEENRIKPDSLLCLAGFSHAADYVCAALIKMFTNNK